MNRDDLTLAVIVAGGVAGLFHSHLPPIYSVVTADETRSPELRMTEYQVAGLGLAAAAGVSALARSWAPLMGAAVVVGAMIAQYEYAGRY